RRQRPLRAHPADLQRLPVPRHADGRPAHVDSAERAPRRPADRLRGALPGRRLAGRRGRLGAVARQRRRSAVRPQPRPAWPVKRVAALIIVLTAAAAVAVFGSGAGGDSGGGYKVRAIFDSAFSVIPGEDVKVAGVKVGKIDSMDVTADKKA